MSINVCISPKRSFLILCLVAIFHAARGNSPDPIQGAWRSASDDVQEILLFQDGYFSHSRFDRAAGTFLMSRGGPYTREGNKFSVLYEFDSANPDETGKRYAYVVSLRGGQLDLKLGGGSQRWTRIDDSSAPLAGVWKISERMQMDSWFRSISGERVKL